MITYQIIGVLCVVSLVIFAGFTLGRMYESHRQYQESLPELKAKYGGLPNEYALYTLKEWKKELYRRHLASPIPVRVPTTPSDGLFLVRKQALMSEICRRFGDDYTMTSLLDDSRYSDFGLWKITSSKSCDSEYPDYLAYISGAKWDICYRPEVFLDDIIANTPDKSRIIVDLITRTFNKSN